MDFYPKEFPPESIRKVEAESIKAGQVVDDARAELMKSALARYGLISQITELVADCILRVWAVFASEACELARRNIWDVVELELQVREFLTNLTAHFRAEKGYDATGSPIVGIGRAVNEKFRESTVKKQYDAERLQIAEQPATPAHDGEGGVVNGLAPKTGRASAAKVVNWEQVEIRVLSDDRVQIIAGDREESLNYAELGFEDARKGTANSGWQILLELAGQKGTIPDDLKSGKKWLAAGKRIERLRKTLQNHFKLSSDPLPYTRSTGYRARFKITRAPSADR